MLLGAACINGFHSDPAAEAPLMALSSPPNAVDLANALHVQLVYLEHSLSTLRSNEGGGARAVEVAGALFIVRARLDRMLQDLPPPPAKGQSLDDLLAANSSSTPTKQGGSLKSPLELPAAASSTAMTTFGGDALLAASEDGTHFPKKAKQRLSDIEYDRSKYTSLREKLRTSTRAESAPIIAEIVFKTFDDPSFTRMSFYWALVSLSVIACSLLMVCVESDPMFWDIPKSCEQLRDLKAVVLSNNATNLTAPCDFDIDSKLGRQDMETCWEPTYFEQFEEIIQDKFSWYHWELLDAPGGEQYIGNIGVRNLGHHRCQPDVPKWFEYIEVFCIVIFTLEYLARLSTAWAVAVSAFNPDGTPKRRRVASKLVHYTRIQRTWIFMCHVRSLSRSSIVAGLTQMFIPPD